MLILLPPSEKKKAATGHGQFDISALSFANELTLAREFGISRIVTTETSPAIDIYAGVLYQGLGWDSLPSQIQKRANSRVLIVSALFGLLKPFDQIFSYKSKIDSKLWREPISAVAKKFENDLVVDCRSSTYKGVWPVNPESTIEVRVFKVEGGERSVITHMSKKYRGELARHLLLQNSDPQSPSEVQIIAAQLFECELHPPIDGQPWALDLLIS